MESLKKALPNKLKVSAMTATILQKIDPQNPTHLIYNQLSGEALKVSGGTYKFIENLKKQKNISKKQLLQMLDSHSYPALKLLIEKKILISDSTSDEFETYQDYYPLVREAISYTTKGNGKVFVVASYTGVIEVKEYKPKPFCLSFLKMCDGQKSLRQIVKELAAGGKDAFETKKQIKDLLENELSKPDLQLVKFSPAKLGNLDKESPLNGYLNAYLREFEHSKEALAIKNRSLKKGRVTDLSEFHRQDIKEAFHEFDEVEITVSHAFRRPNKALNGNTYGGAFFDELMRRNFVHKNSRILEVGGGTGVFSNCFLNRAHLMQKEFAQSLKYEIVDLSPVLQKSQQKLNKKFKNQMKFYSMNAEDLPLPKKSIDLLICNEVVADFKTVAISKKDAEKAMKKKWSARPTDSYLLSLYLLKKYKINFSDAPKEFHFNLGTVLFLERIKNILSKNGMAVLTEFGDILAYPTGTYHLNHNEYSIHWGQMMKVAQELGFTSVSLIDLQSFIQINPYVEMVDGDIEEIQYIFKKFGKNPPPKAAYDRQEMEKILKSLKNVKIEGISYSPLFKKNAWGPTIDDFKVLMLHN